MISRCVAVDPAEFAREHWGRAPLLSRSADLPRDFQDLLSPDAVDELIAERGVRTPFIRLARNGSVLDRECFAGSAGFGAEMPDQVDSAKVLAEFAAGATIVLQGLHRLWPPIIDFVRTMVDDLGHPAQTNAYITPASNRGFDPHYDVHDVFVLQVSGEKHWAVHAPVHRDPLPNQPWTDHRDAIGALAHDRPVIDAVLAPGDALYLPRGWIHSAMALGDTSIHLTVGVAPFTRYDIAHRVLTSLADDADLRASLPMNLDLTDHDAVGSEVRKTVERILDTLKIAAPEDAVAQSISDRFGELTRPAAVRPLQTLATISNLTAATPVQWRHGLIGSVRRRTGTVELSLPGRTITFPDVCADALDAIRAGRPATAGTLPGLTEEDGLVVVRRLLREAVVVAPA
ncbi:cupin domain-containing protein [Antrihabitans cavernicola]|uniref:Cupin n=1 Tax=Antrihabitans cavernicola TaxID=2495913 RepID=A0A5A7SJ93_9NOCA|nr:cupin domain-containing protein [Spelaeibacter cavernicola]KAA0024505.1 cupin [Spelaeibacter cavernicola]